MVTSLTATRRTGKVLSARGGDIDTQRTLADVFRVVGTSGTRRALETTARFPSVIAPSARSRYGVPRFHEVCFVCSVRQHNSPSVTGI